MNSAFKIIYVVIKTIPILTTLRSMGLAVSPRLRFLKKTPVISDEPTTSSTPKLEAGDDNNWHMDEEVEDG